MTPLLKLEREMCQWKHPTRETEAEEVNWSELGCWKISSTGYRVTPPQMSRRKYREQK